jgi:hypothetical protein
MMTTDLLCEWRRDGKACQPVERLRWAQPGIGQTTAAEAVPGDCELRLTIPLDEINGIWMPYGDRSSLQKLVWNGTVQAGPTRALPPGIHAWACPSGDVMRIQQE